MKFILTIVTIVISHHCTCQDNGLFHPNRSLMINGGYTYQGQHIIEFGAKSTSLSKFSSNEGQEVVKYLDYSYLIFGGEFVLNPQVQVAPKVGVGYNLLFLNANINLIMFNEKFRKFYPAIVPEIGVSILGIFQLNYGYNLYFFDPVVFSQFRHRISLRVNLFINDAYWNG